MEKRIKEYLEEKKRAGLLRSLKPVTILDKGRLLAGGKEFVNFSSNDYLGLAGHPDIIKAAKDALAPVFGTSSSRLMAGDTVLHNVLEERTAVFKKKEAALVFNSGYQANVGIISALCGKGDVIFSDRLNHASIVDGIMLSGARFFRFRHNDPGHLEELIAAERKKYKNVLIVTETVFSMDGDVAPLIDLAKIKRKYDALLMVDEAHATGIFGPNGEGIAEETGARRDCDIIMGTFSKALGGFGAYAATSSMIKEYLINTSRSFIYSTALPASIINADITALEIVKQEPFRRKSLLANAAYLRERLSEEGFSVGGVSQIVPVVIGENEKTVGFAEKLKQKGYWVTPVRPPTVPAGSARLRISLTYDHDRCILDRFIADIMDINKDDTCRK